MIGLRIIAKIWVNVPVLNTIEIYNQKIWVNVPFQYFEIYNQYGYNFLYFNSWFVLPRPAVSTTAQVLNWKRLPLFQFLICRWNLCSGVELKMIGLSIIGKIWVGVPTQYFEIYNQKFWVNVPIQYFEIYNQYRYNFLYSNSWFVVELTNCDLVQGFAKACHEYHSPSVELETIISIPIPDM